GGNNRATALSLNACPYFANSFSHHRPRVIDSIGATSILTRGAFDRSFPLLRGFVEPSTKTTNTQGSPCLS
ncbi:hypothetical protein VSR69_46030, partial [Paraburkholderia phytofirmans]